MFNHCLNFPESNTFYVPPFKHEHETRFIKISNLKHVTRRENRLSVLTFFIVNQEEERS